MRSLRRSLSERVNTSASRATVKQDCPRGEYSEPPQGVVEFRIAPPVNVSWGGPLTPARTRKRKASFLAAFLLLGWLSARLFRYTVRGPTRGRWRISEDHRNSFATLTSALRVSRVPASPTLLR